MTAREATLKANLLGVLNEVVEQSNVGECFPDDLQSLPDQVEQIREWIEDAGEFGVAYQSLVALLDRFEFLLTSQAAIRLLEAGLLMRFKSDLPVDAQFDSR